MVCFLSRLNFSIYICCLNSLCTIIQLLIPSFIFQDKNEENLNKSTGADKVTDKMP